MFILIHDSQFKTAVLVDIRHLVKQWKQFSLSILSRRRWRLLSAAVYGVKPFIRQALANTILFRTILQRRHFVRSEMLHLTTAND